MKVVTKRPDGTVRVHYERPDIKCQVQQHMKDHTDINKIMKKYHQTGMINHLNNRQGQYLDLSKVKDYQQSLDTVIEAQQSFMTLSSEVRKKFNNDPQEVINFLKDPKNTEEAIILGLKQKPKPPSENQQIITELQTLNKNTSLQKNAKPSKPGPSEIDS